MTITSQRKKQFRAIGHHLKPIVTISENGLSETVVEELNRALNDHELIKIKVNGDRLTRKEINENIGQLCEAELIQSLGNTALIYRPAAKPNPQLSNILRAVNGQSKTENK